jgi:hypothetical protein
VYCKGHCGGHIKPTINLAITYTFEGLAYQDAVVMDASFMSAYDFEVLYNSLMKKQTVASWTKEINHTTGKWFRPLPNGPVSAVAWAIEGLEGTGLKVFRWWRNFWLNLAGESVDDESFDAGEGSDISKTSNEKDEHGFKGWFDTRTSTSNNPELNRSLMRELYDLYGTPEDMYQKGIEMWSYFDVEFNLGFGETLSTKEINDIMDAISETYGDRFTPDRQAVVKEALSRVGYYTYNCTYEGHMNGIYSRCGMSECTGFVSGVYARALGPRCGFWNDLNKDFKDNQGRSPRDYGTGVNGKGEGGHHRNYGGVPGDGVWQAETCVYNGTRPYGRTDMRYNRRPGDIICWDGGGAPHGHSMIYLGQYTDPITGVYGAWYVECRGGDGSVYAMHTNTEQYQGTFSPFNAQFPNNPNLQSN